MKRILSNAIHKYRYIGSVCDDNGRDLIQYIDLSEIEWRQTRASSYDKAISQIKYKIRQNLRDRGIFVPRGIIKLNEKDIIDLDSEPIIDKQEIEEPEMNEYIEQLSLFED